MPINNIAVILATFVLLLNPLNSHEIPGVSQQPELTKLVRNWSEKIGGELWHFGELVTRKKTVTESFKQYRVEREDGEAMLKEIVERVKKMMDSKVLAVKRIMEVAENKAVTQSDYVEPSFDYYNAKNLTNSAPNGTLDEQEVEGPQVGAVRGNDDAYGAKNGEKSRNMVQPDDADGYLQDDSGDANSAEDVLTRSADVEITDGSEQDPLASQAPPEDKRRLPFVKNANFYNILVNTNNSVVHVPSNVYDRSKDVIKGIKWSEELDNTFKNNYKEDPRLSWQYFGSSTGFMRQFPAVMWDQEPTDLFDCRMRPWYVEAASSPKDVVILVDRSGSMTGMRREVARHVVNNILETLSNNDYVNIFTFSNTTDPLVECFDNLLVQANLANIRILKDTMASFKTEQIANFSLALTTAFQILQQYREKGMGAKCNQAIMLITDGVQYNYIEVFREYNWQNLPFMPVRVFTYLIGREVSDVREVKWMACANQGYYVHLSTYSEVREQVLQYIPVMARPMVLNPTNKPKPAWSPVYADVADPKLTNWFWTTRQRERQRQRFLNYRRNRTLPERDANEYEMNWIQDTAVNLQDFRLMTSVSLPVYDKRPNANITENIQINEAIWISVTRETRVANLLGVAGTDVPIEYIRELMMPYRLGVNAYAFIVTNNGYILTHPDFRPVFEGILKPAYNRVDMIEVEIVDDENEPRNFNEELLRMRDKVVMQIKGNATMNMKIHLDQKRRIFMQRRHFYFTGIDGTPFSLVLSLPDRYGFYKAQSPTDSEPSRLRANNNDPLQYFTGNWKIHPDWHYCRYLDRRETFDSPEEEFAHFVRQMLKPGWKWTDTCDRKLIIKFIADAEATKWFNQNISLTTKDENGHEFIAKFGITVAFMATHSGLTRWQDFSQNMSEKEVKDKPHFHEIHNRAIDEVWYRRAIEQYYLEKRSFVYSVPFEAGADDGTLVTASHAIFREETSKRAPVAVVGFQFKHTALYDIFNSITNKCGEIKCKRTCNSPELHCLLLDDNGYVIVSDEREETGKFFGRLRSDIMDQLIRDGIYTQNKVYDYQATCEQPVDVGNPASHFSNPLTFAYALIKHLLVNISYYVGVAFCSHWDDEFREFVDELLIAERTKRPCDREHSVFVATRIDSVNNPWGNFVYWIEPVPQSNLYLLCYRDYCDSRSHLQAMVLERAIDYGRSWECRVNDDNRSERVATDDDCFGDEPFTESDILACGRSGTVPHVDESLLIAPLVLALLCMPTTLPLTHLSDLLRWTIGTVTFLARTVWSDEFAITNNNNVNNYHDQLDNEPHDDSGDDDDDDAGDHQMMPTKVNEKEFDSRLLITKTKPEPCDKEMYIYTLTHYTSENISKSRYNETMSTDCTRPFVIQPVVSSNMVLLVINNICPQNEIELQHIPIEVDYNMTFECYRVANNNFSRRHYTSCINRSPLEPEIKLCGRGSSISSPVFLATLLTLIMVMII